MGDGFNYVLGIKAVEEICKKKIRLRFLEPSTVFYQHRVQKLVRTKLN